MSEQRSTTSSFCVDGGCIAVSIDADGGVTLKSSTVLDGPTLSFTPEEWQAFLAGVRNGEFDYEALSP